MVRVDSCRDSTCSVIVNLGQFLALRFLSTRARNKSQIQLGMALTTPPQNAGKGSELELNNLHEYLSNPKFSEWKIKLLIHTFIWFTYFLFIYIFFCFLALWITLFTGSVLFNILSYLQLYKMSNCVSAS